MIPPGPGWYVYIVVHSHSSDFADLHGPFGNPEEIFEYLAENEIPYSEKRSPPRIAPYYFTEMRDGFIADYTPIGCGIHFRQ